jgi:hypothetical protein
MNNVANFGQHFAAIQQTLISLNTKIQSIEHVVSIMNMKLNQMESKLSDASEPVTEQRDTSKICVETPPVVTERLDGFESRLKAIEVSLSSLDSIFSKLNAESSASPVAPLSCNVAPDVAPRVASDVSHMGAPIDLQVQSGVLNLDGDEVVEATPIATTTSKRKGKKK